MIDLSKLNRGERAFVNALVVGGIAFFSTLSTTGGIPTIPNITTGMIAAGLACLIRVNDFLDRENENKVKTDEEKNKFRLGMVIP